MDKFSFDEMFSSGNFSFGKLINDAGTFANVLKEAGQGMLDSFESFMARFKGAYPQLLRMVIFGAAIGIVQAMFPEGRHASFMVASRTRHRNFIPSDAIAPGRGFAP